jgi:hypothetical protein
MQPTEFTAIDEFTYRGLQVPADVCYIVKDELREDGITYLYLENKDPSTEMKSIAKSMKLPQEKVNKKFSN